MTDEITREMFQHSTVVIAGLNDRIEALEAEVEWLTSLVSDLYDEDDCYHDHHGYCQAHGWFATEPTCPHKRAREVLGDFDQ